MNYSLRSNYELLLQPLTTGAKKTLGDRAFASAAPKLWNGLPGSIRNANITELNFHNLYLVLNFLFTSINFCSVLFIVLYMLCVFIVLYIFIQGLVSNFYLTFIFLFIFIIFFITHLIICTCKMCVTNNNNYYYYYCYY